MFKNFSWIYLCRQSILVLEVQPYLFDFDLATFRALFSLFLVLQAYFLGSLGLVLGSKSGSNTFLEATKADYKFSFWKGSPISCF